MRRCAPCSPCVIATGHSCHGYGDPARGHVQGGHHSSHGGVGAAGHLSHAPGGPCRRAPFAGSGVGIGHYPALYCRVSVTGKSKRSMSCFPHRFHCPRPSWIVVFVLADRLQLPVLCKATSCHLFSRGPASCRLSQHEASPGWPADRPRRPARQPRCAFLVTPSAEGATRRGPAPRDRVIPFGVIPSAPPAWPSAPGCPPRAHRIALHRARPLPASFVSPCIRRPGSRKTSSTPHARRPAPASAGGRTRPT